MKIKIYITSILLVSLLFFGCEKYPVPTSDGGKADKYAPVKIYNVTQEKPHAAFPSLIRFKDAFYCSFREAPSHTGAGGLVRLLKSTDGVKWETAHIFSFESEDPELSPELEFNGVNQYMTIDPHTDFNFTNSESFSISCWVYTENTTYTQIVSTRNGGNGYDFAQQSNKLINDFANPYLRTEQKNGNLTSGTWHHAGYVYDGTAKTLKLYQDGIAVELNVTATFHPQTAVTTQENTYGNYITVFAKASNKVINATSGFTKGKLKNLRFWKKTLSDAEMFADMTATVTASTPGLVAAYDFNKREEQGTEIIVPDIKGNHPGKLHNFTMVNNNFDARDGYLSITPDNRLMINFDKEYYSGNSIVLRRPCVSYSTDGENFSEPVECTLYNADNTLKTSSSWIWHVVWNKGTGYGFDYMGGITLFETADGTTYRTVTRNTIDDNPSEIHPFFDTNDKMYAFIRRNTNGYLGISLPPYTDWVYEPLDYQVHGQMAFFLNEQTICLGTRYWDEGNQQRMAVLVTDLHGKIKKEIVLRSAGDCSYPGMVIYDNILWVAYYSSHEGVSCIYLSKIPLSDLMPE